MQRQTRRTFMRTLLGSGAVVTIVPQRLFGQAALPPIRVNRLSDRLMALTGDGGNIGLLLGPDGLLMIDGGLVERAADLARAIADVDKRPVQVLFNTHYHFDHVGSNERLGRAGAPGAAPVRIIAHEAVKTRLGQRMVNEAFGRTFEPLMPQGLPTETYLSSGRMNFGDNRLDYSHVGPAHTDGDTFVFMQGENALYTGDLFWMGRYPVVDYSAGGSLAAMGDALDTMDRVIDDTTRIVPGHGPVSTRADMRAVRDAWGTINARIEMMVKEGRTLEQVTAAAPTREFDATYGTATRDGFVRQTYGGVRARLQP